MEIVLPLALLLLPLAWWIGNYNGLVRMENHCKESWSGVDTELKRRYDLIPNLVRTVQGYAAHEAQTLQHLAAARANAVSQEVTEVGQQQTALVQELHRLVLVAENYPALRADAHFLELQHELVNTEDRIQAARRFFNANVRDLNNRVEMFPSSLVASMGGFRTRLYFEVQELALPRVQP